MPNHYNNTSSSLPGGSGVAAPLQVSCDLCSNGFPSSNMYTGSVCPEGTIPTGSGNPCLTTTTTTTTTPTGPPCYALDMNGPCVVTVDEWTAQGEQVYDASFGQYYPGQVVAYVDPLYQITNYFTATAASASNFNPPASISNPQSYPEPTADNLWDVSTNDNGYWEGCNVITVACVNDLINTPTGVIYAPPNTVVSKGCSVIGPGIPAGTTVTSVQIHYNPLYLEVTLNQMPDFNYTQPYTEDDPATQGVVDNGFNSESELTNLTFGFSAGVIFVCNQYEDVSVEEVYNTFEKTVSFKEDIKGWVSFKSFTPENAISMANDYYTFNHGGLYKHHQPGDRNNFYNKQYNSSVTVVLNDNPSYIKEFTTLNYEGSQSNVELFGWEVKTLDFQPPTVYDNQEYYNLSAKDGWYTEFITTNDEDGYINEFLEKEGKWFNYIKRKVDLDLNEADTSDFSFQGIGEASAITVISNNTITGCMDVNALNYNPIANVDDGSCCSIGGCMDPGSDNYNPDACFAGNCFIAGCTIASALNYNPNATDDNGSCIVYGCMECGSVWEATQAVGVYCDDKFGPAILPGSSNYNPLATLEDGSCSDIYGCMDINAFNYNPLANINDNTCAYFGCTDPTAINYNPIANVDDGSCTYVTEVYGCTNSLASNYDPLATIDDGTCSVIIGAQIPGCTCGGNATNGTLNGLGNYNSSCNQTGYPAANFDPLANFDDGSCISAPPPPPPPDS